jgi:hypothetical protein
MTSTDQWITGAAAVGMLRDAGVVDLGVLGVWAHDGLLRSRGRVERIAGRVETDTPTHNEIPRWFWGHLRAAPVTADWAAGVFETTTDIDTEEEGWREVSWRISGVEFNDADLQKCLRYANPPQNSAARGQHGILPDSAKPSDRKYENEAHNAASIVRSEGVLPSKAFNRLAAQRTDLSIQINSVESAIRRAYGLMYDKNGYPHQN